MTELSVHTELPKKGATVPLAGWLPPSMLVIGGLLAAALIGAVLTPQSGSMSKAAAPELPFMGMITGGSAPQSMRIAVVVPAAASQPSFAFGFLEFDWDPSAPGGVPGFDPWPNQDLRVAQANLRD